MISCETKNAEITADSGEPVLGHNNSPIEGTDKKPLKWTFFYQRYLGQKFNIKLYRNLYFSSSKCLNKIKKKILNAN